MGDGIAYELLRFRTRDGDETTVYLTRHPLRSTRLSAICFDEPARLDQWCAAEGHAEAIVAGFFVRDPYRPLGEVRVGGSLVGHEPVAAPWAERRACVHVDGAVRLASRGDLPAEPPGDLVQAGPLLVRDGRSAVARDHEGFTAGAHQFDSDITVGRYPRCALAVTGASVLAVACDGRADDDAGMTLGELAGALVGLGAVSAINLDGGGSSSLVFGGTLVNRPREEHGIDLLDGRQVATAPVFDLPG
jgi:phosphodiester glycosidase